MNQFPKRQTGASSKKSITFIADEKYMVYTWQMPNIRQIGQIVLDCDSFKYK